MPACSTGIHTPVVQNAQLHLPGEDQAMDRYDRELFVALTFCLAAALLAANTRTTCEQNFRNITTIFEIGTLSVFPC